jgi:hypothetical protein
MDPGEHPWTRAGAVGRIDVAIEPASGTVNFVPEPSALVSLLMIVAFAIASQFLTTSLIRLGPPLIAVLAIAVFIWQASVEWRLLRRHLQATAHAEVDGTPN